MERPTPLNLLGVVRLVCVAVVLSDGFRGAYSAVHDVRRFGAKGDGMSDNTQAFLKAWQAACADSARSELLVPKDRAPYLIGRIELLGPCNSNVKITVDGDIAAMKWDLRFRTEDEWIVIRRIDNLEISGRGTLDGRGIRWWDCKNKGGCGNPPNLFAFLGCENVTLTGLQFINSPSKHVTFHGCKNVWVSNIKIIAPESSPNTDGLLVSRSQFVFIHDSVIGTGDDCVAIIDGSSNVNISHIDCGPGHGISIGSLGKDFSMAKVEAIFVTNCNFSGTTNGVRIKTWQGGSGYVKNGIFKDLRFNECEFPIVIDQFYCPKGGCKNHTSAVKISDVSFEGVRGTSRKTESIRLACSKTVPCQDIFIHDVSLQSVDRDSVSFCDNAYGNAQGPVFPPVHCLG